MPKIIFLLLSILISATSEYPQNIKTKSWKYFAQTSPGKTAHFFAPGFIKHLAHSSPTFSPDGKEIFWSIVAENGETRKICYSQYSNGEWSEPHVAPFSGKHHDDQPFMSYDGRKLYFASKRPKACGEEPDLGIWITTRTEKGWSEPSPLPGFWTPSVTRRGTLYYWDGKPGSEGTWGIFKCELKDGEYSPPEFMPEKINRKNSQNWCPFIAADESYLLFSSDREGGFGSGDLYICFKDKSGEWQEPVNLGESVNTPQQERFPGVSPDGNFLFFTRWYGPPNQHDLYWIDAGIINVIKEQSR